MAKSHTSKKHKKSSASADELTAVKTAVESTVKYVKDWKRNQLWEIVKFPVLDNIPVYLPVQNDAFIIGFHQVRRCEDNLWELYDRKYENTYFFRSKLTAIIFSLCLHKGKDSLANSIIADEELIIRLNNKQKHIAQLLKRNKNDAWKDEFYKIKQQTLAYKVQDARFRLEKSLTEAKYLKIWDMP